MSPIEMSAIKCLLHISFVMSVWPSFYPFLRKVCFVGNKAKERISKRVFQENKARQISLKTNISYPLIRTCTCDYQGVKNVRSQKIWRALFSWNTRFEIRPFALLPALFELFTITNVSYKKVSLHNILSGVLLNNFMSMCHALRNQLTQFFMKGISKILLDNHFLKIKKFKMLEQIFSSNSSK